MLLIFDLDDTLFETKSIGKRPFEAVFDRFGKHIYPFYPSKVVREIIEDLWSIPLDAVSLKYDLSHSITGYFIQLINVLEMDFEIQPYPDYQFVKSVKARKVLVTTGIKKLQEAKINLLGIRSDFDEIFIDAIDSEDRIFKRGIFKQILEKSTLPENKHIVIGDNPELELKDGHELGFTTIQVVKLHQRPSPFVNFVLSNYRQLDGMLKNLINE